MSNFWLAVVSAQHVRQGVEFGIVQTNHGKPQGIRRMSPGDGLVYYSPKTSYPDGEPLKAFTAVGRIADGEPWQSDVENFKPWRRKVHYDLSTDVSLAELQPQLEFTQEANWGYQLRRGVVPITERDFALIRQAITSTTA